MHLYVTRHGHTTPDKHLSDVGKQQAHALGAYLMETLSNKMLLYSSDLVRAEQTADILSAYLDKRLRLNPLLREYRTYKEQEEWVDFSQRITDFLYSLVQVIPDHESVLWVTHGGVFDVLMGLISGVGIAGQAFVVLTHHTGLSHFEWRDEKLHMIYHDQLEHLADVVLHTF